MLLVNNFVGKCSDVKKLYAVPNSHDWCKKETIWDRMGLCAKTHKSVKCTVYDLHLHNSRLCYAHFTFHFIAKNIYVLLKLTQVSMYIRYK